jgi:hypothetical protein
MIFRLLPLLFGLYFAYAGAGFLALAAVGERVDATVDETVVKAVKEVPASDGSAPSYVMRTKVAYHFDLCPRRAPQQAQSDVICVKAEGSDTRILSSPYSVLAHDRGYAVPVVFLRPAPWVNAVRQPKHLVVYGLLELLLGLAVVAFEVKVIMREHQARLAAAQGQAPPDMQRADPWRDLDKPLGSDDSRPPRQDDGIQPS